MIKWQEVFSKDGLPWQDATQLSSSIALSELNDLKRLLDAVHIRLCLVKPYQENKNYPLVEARELLPSFDNDMKSGRLPSLLFFGPPGCGKSTLALLLAKSTGRPYLRLSAPEAGLQHLRRSLTGVEILVLDELHRFSKAQQDFFLPLVESGDLTLLATTTENPSFSVTRQLLSRLHVLRLRPLGRPELMELARRGAGDLQIQMPDDVADLLAGVSHGDARTLLNLVEYVAALPEDVRDLEHIKAALPEVLIRHDKDGDNHYELASALIKSIRGSDVDAALYYLACLLEGGEDPRFVCRRLILSASEDIGLADPDALGLAVACQQAVEFVGMIVPKRVIDGLEAVEVDEQQRTVLVILQACRNSQPYAVRQQGPIG